MDYLQLAIIVLVALTLLFIVVSLLKQFLKIAIILVIVLILLIVAGMIVRNIDFNESTGGIIKSIKNMDIPQKIWAFFKGLFFDMWEWIKQTIVDMVGR